MLQLGSSKPWPDAMEQITGQRRMDARPLMEYFQPLLEFLKKENGDDFGWAEECPGDLPPCGDSAATLESRPWSQWFLVFIAVISYVRSGLR